jgi:CRP/FNR family transcriptional regulator, cyclic AMP receptor protein
VPNRPPSGGAGSPWPASTLLDRLPPGDRDAMIALGLKTSFRPGERIMRQGDPRGPVYLLLGGRKGTTACVKVTATTDNGTDALLGIRVTGDVVGELAALRDPGHRSATVTTCSETTTAKIPYQDFLAFLDRRPACWKAVTGNLTERLDWANRRQLDFAGYEVRHRLARVIVELARRHGYETEQGRRLGVQLSQEELGMLVGAKKDAAKKAMRELGKLRVVSSGYRRVIVHDMTTLCQVAEGEK